MIWFVPTFAALVLVYLAARFDRFRRFLEPALTVAVALALVSAFIVWTREDGNKGPSEPQTSTQATVLAPADLNLSGLDFQPSTPETSFRVKGTVTNNGTVPLDYFRLTATLSDCAADPCKVVGSDTALIIARANPDEALPFETFFTIPNPNRLTPVKPTWTTEISDVRMRGR